MSTSSLIISSSEALSFGRSRPRLEQVLNSWVAFRIAWILCVDYGGVWVPWNMVKSRFLETASESRMYMADENVFKHILLTMIYDYGLIEPDEYPQDPQAWQRCIEEWKERSKRDRRIRKSPEEHCRNKVRRVVNIRAKPVLCRLLLDTVKRKRYVVTPPARLVRAVEMLEAATTELGGANEVRVHSP